VWGDLVRAASPHKGAWPRVSVWHGGADATVIPPNATEIVKQWTDVHGLQAQPSLQTVVDGYPRQVWISEADDELIESYTIPKMAHGTPLAAGEADDQCGAAGPFLLEVGISSSYHIARFFGLTGTRRPVETMRGHAVTIVPGIRQNSGTTPRPPALDGEVLGPEVDTSPELPHIPPSSHFDIGAVITKALTAAGLMKGR
jgi:feruloyl esterase